MLLTLLFCGILAINALEVPDLAAAITSFESGDYSRSAQMLAQACVGRENCGESRIWLARSYLKLRRWDKAINELKSAVKEAPSSSLAHTWLGRAYGLKAEHSPFFFAIGLARKVVKEFETAHKLDPNNLDIQFDLLEYYLQAPGFLGGGKDKAIAQASEIAQLDKRQGYTARARILEHHEKWQDAQRELTNSAQEFPNQAAAFGDLAAFLFQRKNYAAAEAAAAQALALRPQYPAALLILNASRIPQRKELPAAEAALKALSLGPLQEEDPDFFEVHYWLGMAQQAQDRKAEARASFQKALQFDPEYEPAKSAISRLHLKD